MNTPCPECGGQPEFCHFGKSALSGYCSVCGWTDVGYGFSKEQARVKWNHDAEKAAYSILIRRKAVAWDWAQEKHSIEALDVMEQMMREEGLDPKALRKAML